VDRLASGALTLDGTGTRERAEVFRHGLTSNGKLGRKFGRRRLATLGERLKQEPPVRITERSEDVRPRRARRHATPVPTTTPQPATRPRSRAFPPKSPRARSRLDRRPT